MNATLDLYSLTLAAADATQSNDPVLRYADWKRSIKKLAVQNPKTDPYTIQPGVEQLIFDGSRALTVDGTTVFSLALSPLAPDVYRITNTAGTAPGFRTDRALNLSGVALTLTAQVNGSMLIVAGAGTPFAALQAGDEVLVPGLSTGDVAGPFNAVNEGRWAVLAIGGAGASVTLVRFGDFQGLSEVVTPASAGQFLGFAPAGVQPGDSLSLSAGFAASALKSFEILAVTPKWLEIQSTKALAAESGIAPGAAGFQIYSASKRFLQIEVDQEAVIKLNGYTGEVLRIQPWVAGDPQFVAEYRQTGPVWSLKVLNKSSLPMNLFVLSVE